MYLPFFYKKSNFKPIENCYIELNHVYLNYFKMLFENVGH